MADARDRSVGSGRPSPWMHRMPRASLADGGRTWSVDLMRAGSASAHGRRDAGASGAALLLLSNLYRRLALPPGEGTCDFLPFEAVR